MPGPLWLISGETTLKTEPQLGDRSVVRDPPGDRRTLSPSFPPGSGYRSKKQKLLFRHELQHSADDIRVGRCWAFHHCRVLYAAGLGAQTYMENMQGGRADRIKGAKTNHLLTCEWCMKSRSSPGLFGRSQQSIFNINNERTTRTETTENGSYQNVFGIEHP